MYCWKNPIKDFSRVYKLYMFECLKPCHQYWLYVFLVSENCVFTCDGTHCLENKSLICDQVYHCQDKTDEHNCPQSSVGAASSEYWDLFTTRPLRGSQEDYYESTSDLLNILLSVKVDINAEVNGTAPYYHSLNALLCVLGLYSI